MDCYECCVCYRPYEENERRPCVLKCGHTFCMFCLKRIKYYEDEEKRHCPTCRKQFKRFRVNFAFETLSQVHEDSK